MKKTMTGTLFAIPYMDGKYLFGRVVLDIPGNIKRRLFPTDSPFAGLHARSFVVEVYSKIASKPEFSPSPLLLPGAFVEPIEIGKTWPILGELKIDPQTVEFSEYLIGFNHSNGEIAFRCGEIHIPIPFTQDDLRHRMRVMGALHTPSSLPSTCQWALGISNKYKFDAPEYSDLRFSKHRARVYEHLPFPMEMSYFEKQKMMGFNLERLYE